MLDAWPLWRLEQLVDNGAKPRLEHVHLAFGDGHALWPVIDHAPSHEVMLHRGPRPAHRREGVIVEVDRDRGRVETRRPATRARTVHPEKVGCAGSQGNDGQPVLVETAVTECK